MNRAQLIDVIACIDFIQSNYVRLSSNVAHNFDVRQKYFYYLITYTFQL